MTFAEIKELLTAGFTAEQIMTLNQTTNPETAPATNPETAPATNPETVPATNPETVPATNPETVPATNPDLNKLNDSINKLIQTLQVSNLQTATVKTTADKTADVDKIMASIIRPERKEGN